jgi:hypothetical protein
MARAYPRRTMIGCVARVHDKPWFPSRCITTRANEAVNMGYVLGIAQLRYNFWAKIPHHSAFSWGLHFSATQEHRSE